MIVSRFPSPHFTRRLQSAATLLVIAYAVGMDLQDVSGQDLLDIQVLRGDLAAARVAYRCPSAAAP